MSVEDQTSHQLATFRLLRIRNAVPCSDFRPVNNPTRQYVFRFCGRCGHDHT